MSKSYTYKTGSLDALQPIVDHLLKCTSEGPKVVFLYGDLGAGKTTLTKEVLAQLGSEDEASSPTYGLVNEYALAEGVFYHIDLYRLNSTEEALDMGIEEYVDSSQYCFVEWPQIIESIMDAYWSLTIEMDEDEVRTYKMELVQYG